jgi:hypothetical protein
MFFWTFDLQCFHRNALTFTFFLTAASKSSEVEHGKMDATTKVLSIFFQFAFIAVTSLIIFKTVSAAGIVLFTFHPSLMALGVSVTF